jgi:hypothetical protein
MISGDYTNKADWTDIDLYICDDASNYSILKRLDLCTGARVPLGYTWEVGRRDLLTRPRRL